MYPPRSTSREYVGTTLISRFEASLLTRRCRARVDDLFTPPGWRNVPNSDADTTAGVRNNAGVAVARASSPPEIRGPLEG